MVDIKLMKGDCLELMKEIPDGSVDFVLTDPPFGVTKCAWDSVIPFEPMWEELHRVTKKDGAIVLFGSEPFSSALRMSNIKNYKYDWIWEKSKATGFLNSKRQPLRSHENILVFYRKQCLYIPQKKNGTPYNKGVRKDQSSDDVYGSFESVEVKSSDGLRYPRSVQYFKTAEREGGFHKSQKPVDLLKYLIKTYTNEGDTVLDFTAGSMSTAVACINTNRNCIMIEKDEHYYNVGKDRVISALKDKGLTLDNTSFD